jgi:uncharacterized metal-binding protein
LAARPLKDSKVRKMNCLPMIAIGNEPLITAFEPANVLAIDGCTVDCGRKIMEKNRNYGVQIPMINKYGLQKWRLQWF